MTNNLMLFFITIAFFIIFVLLYLYPTHSFNKGMGIKEGLENVKKNDQTNTNSLKSPDFDKLKEGDGDKAFEIGNDALFSDVIYFKSDPVIDGEYGIEKCMKSCKGTCVEYGITTNAHCYPYDDAIVKQNYRNSVEENLKSEEQ